MAFHSKKIMRDIYFLTAVAALFGLTFGLANAAAPQAVIALKLSSFDLGLVGAGVPAGYALSCLLCGVLLSAARIKRVLLVGVAGAVASMLWMALARGAGSLVAAQMLLGVSGGAAWPFCSGWMLDFESEKISRDSILRHYNVAWTAGTAAGMYGGGWLCGGGLIFETFYFSACAACATFVCALLAREASTHAALLALESSPESAPASPVDGAGAGRERATLAALFGAGLFNLSAIGTKMLIGVNYAELNERLGGRAERMGMFTAAAVLSQLAAFGLGKMYEPLLGSRRVYAAGALLLICANLAFALSTSLWLLLPAVAVTGFVLAMAFQAAMIAFTSRASAPRNGTAMAEALVGFAGLAPLAAGGLTESLKNSGLPEIAALRAPFFAAMALVATALVAQIALVSPRFKKRLLATGEE